MFNDELLEIQKDTFHRIVLGIGAVGIVTAVASLFFGGFNSPWFLRAVVLVMAAAVAYVVSIFRRLEVASYVLVFQLVVLSLAAFLQPDALNSIIPYLFIPIVIITGTLLKPRVSLVVTGGLIVITLLLHIWEAGAATSGVSALAFPLGLTALTALLMAINARNLMLYDERLLINRTLLKSRALEVMQANNLLDKLEQQTTQLEKRFQETRSTADQLQTSFNQRLSVLMALIDGSVTSLNEAISGLETITEQLADTPALNGQRHLVDEAWQQLYQLRSFVVNLDELAQIEQNSFQLNLSEIDVNRLLMDVVSATQGLVRRKNLEIRVHPTEGLPVVSADPDRLRLVLLHLVNNAIKFTDKGLVELRAEQDGRQMVVMVIDTGLGMTREEANHAFDLFSRGNNPAKRDRQGSGLGLAICRHLIELHGGRMWVTSEPGNGSIFYFSLPLRAVSPPVYTTSQTKTTLRLGASDKFKVGVSQAAPVAVAAQTVKFHSQSASVPAAAAQRVMAAAPERSHFRASSAALADEAADSGATLVMRSQQSSQISRNIQPIHRYQPMYIQRFGYILLGLLAIVMVVVAFLAVINSGAMPTDTSPQPAEARSVSGVEASGDLAAAAEPLGETAPTGAENPTTVPDATPTGMAVNAAAPTVAVVVAVEETATSTPPPPAPPTATPLAPTATALPPTFTATPRPQAAVVFPTSTPAAVSVQPAAVVEAASTPTPAPTATATPAAPVIFVAGPGGISQASAGSDSPAALPLAVEPNSRVSLSRSGQVVYSGQQNGGRDVFVAGPDGQPSNLTQTPADDIQPAWSPDGAQVAFSSGRTGSFKIFSMGVDGSSPTQLTGGRGFDEWPAWSPDGQQVAFVSDRDGNAEIYLMDADGGNLRRLTTNTAEDWPVSWSPGGRWLVFGSNRDGNWNLYLLPAAGGAPVQLTSHPADERDPVWLPNGDIAFAHNGPGNWDIFTLTVPTDQIGPVASENWTQVTDTPQDERFPALVN